MSGPLAESPAPPDDSIALADRADPPEASARHQPASDPILGLKLVELELALDSLQAEKIGFSEAIDAAMQALGGDFLFSLPALGLADGFQKIAVVRLAGGTDPALAFVLLSEDGTSISVRRPDDETAGLTKFSNAFIALLERF